MSVPYDMFTSAFLSKICEFEFIKLEDEDRTAIIDGYLKRAVTAFKKNCKYDICGSMNDVDREFSIDIADSDIDEIVEIVSEGMLIQWLKPYVYRQEILENALNTRDFTTYSPAELLLRIGNAYAKAQKDYTQMIREYSYNHGDLKSLHL